MERIGLGKIQKMNATELAESMPCIVTVEGDDKFVMHAFSDVIVREGIHPRIWMQLKAREALARGGTARTE